MVGRLFAPITLLLLLLATACASRSASAPTTGATVSNAPADDQVVSGAAAWTRPTTVAPLMQPMLAADSAGGKVPAGEGKFDVISDTPWPGDKVRVFFFGVQG